MSNFMALFSASIAVFPWLSGLGERLYQRFARLVLNGTEWQGFRLDIKQWEVTPWGDFWHWFNPRTEG